MDLNSTTAKIIGGAGIALVVAAAVFGATNLAAQAPAPGAPAPGVPATPPLATPAAPGATPSVTITPATSNPDDPAVKIPFSSAPTGAVKTFSKTDADGTKIPYYRFVSHSDRVYVVEIPVSMTRDARSRDEWITLFSVYGRDPKADAELRALSDTFDPYNAWHTGRILEQTQKVVTIKDSIRRRFSEMMDWSAIRMEAKSNNDLIKARHAWSHVEASKKDLKLLIPRLANEKLALGKLLRDAGLLEQARMQFRQTALLGAAPASREAIAKLRAIDGQQVNLMEGVRDPDYEGIEFLRMSDIYRAATEAVQTNP